MPAQNFQKQTVQTLKNYARELQREADRIELIIEGIEADEIEELETVNNTIGVRGLSYCAKYIDAIRQSHIAHRQNSGAYSAETPKRRKRK